MANDVQQGPELPPEGQEKWRELEYSGCFYCDKPWDHHVNEADGTIYICQGCYERRYRNIAPEHIDKE